MKKPSIAGYTIVLTMAVVCGRHTPAAEPDDNAGRRGTYQASTSIEGCNYYVCVPNRYSDDTPAGLHLFFHGQGGQGGAGNFGQWSNHFLERHDLIGINMQYMDGDNAKNSGAKLTAAIDAVQQVTANYKVIAGRGAVGSFSGGGIIHSSYCGKSTRGQEYPFNHNALYGSNYWSRASSGKPLTWFIGLGSAEWDMGKPTLGQTQRGRFGELLADAMKSGSPDIYLKITKGKGHSISDADVADSSAQFRRSDLAYAPFVYAVDFAEDDFRSIVANANALRLAQAARLTAKLLERTDISQEVREKSERLQKLIDKRIDAVVELARELQANDAILFMYYFPIFSRQIAGHSREENMREIQETARQNTEMRNAMAAWQVFGKTYSKFFAGPTLTEEGVTTLERLKEYASETSLLGKMVNEFLQLRAE